MAGLIKVTPEQLNTVASQLATVSQQIEAQLAQAKGNVAPLGSDWAGVAQARFQALYQQWEMSGRQLHQALTGISALTRQAALRYDQNESENAALFSRGV